MITDQPPKAFPSNEQADSLRLGIKIANVTVALVVVVISFWIVARQAFGPASQGGDAWQTGDWMINYAGGLVRRGLTGEIAHYLSLGFHQMLAFIFWVQVFFLAAFFASTFALFLGTSRSPGWLMLFASPAFILFPAMNPIGGMRKEIMVLAVVALLGIVVRFRPPPIFALVPYLLFAVSAFSHESAALATPVLIYLVWIGTRNGTFTKSHRIMGTTYLLLIATSAVFVAAIFPGTTTQTKMICDSWRGIGVREALCGGPIESLALTRQDAIQQVQLAFPGYSNYLALALLALIPLAAIGARKQFWWLTGITYLCLIPLFILGLDYGRWIYLATSLLSIAALATWREADLRP